MEPPFVPDISADYGLREPPPNHGSQEDAVQRFARNGYEVMVNERDILFLDRQTWGLGVLMAILGACAAILTRLSGLGRTVEGMAAQCGPPEIVSIVFPAVAALLLVAVWMVYRTYRIRRDQPVEAMRNILTVDRSAQTVQDAMGRIVAQLEHVKARMHIDWWTRGAMRIVVLSWPGGKRTIYRTCSRRQSLELLALLKQQGLDAN